jgi:hypothetical protein
MRNESRPPEPTRPSAAPAREVWEAPKLIPLDLGNANSTLFTAKHDGDFGPKASAT